MSRPALFPLATCFDGRPPDILKAYPLAGYLRRKPWLRLLPIRLLATLLGSWHTQGAIVEARKYDVRRFISAHAFVGDRDHCYLAVWQEAARHRSVAGEEHGRVQERA